MLHCLLGVYENGGRTRGLKVLPEMLSWLMCMLARTLTNNFVEMQKVMKLPALSYVYKKSGEIISTANQRAFSYCPQTVETMSLRAIREKWDQSACFGFTAIDSAGLSSGVQWDYRLMQMAGQCQAHKFEPLSKKFNMMANSLKSNSGEDTVRHIANS